MPSRTEPVLVKVDCDQPIRLNPAGCTLLSVGACQYLSNQQETVMKMLITLITLIILAWIPFIIIGYSIYQLFLPLFLN